MADTASASLTSRPGRKQVHSSLFSRVERPYAVAMRFYPNTRWVRIVASVLWLGVSLPALFFHPGRHRWFLVVVLLNPVVQLTNLWTNYWQVTEDALEQHGILYCRRLPYRDLRYAGPVRGRFRRWLGKSIELEARQLASPLYVAVKDRAAFLDQVQRRAPQAEIILLEGGQALAVKG